MLYVSMIRDKPKGGMINTRSSGSIEVIGMETAFVLIKALPMMEKEVYASLLQMDAVVETHSVYGEYDLVARLDFSDSKEMTRFLIEDMRTIPGVVKTETLISAEV
jgi:DNA-binding Lrp family transcriptional regulator